MRKRNTAGIVALCGLLGALAIVIMLLGGWLPLFTFCCPVLVMFLMVPVMRECGDKWALVWYAVVCALSLILTLSNPEAATIFIFLGYYPVLRKYLDRIRLFPLRLACKLLIFNGAVALAYTLLIFLFRLEELLQEYRETGTVLLVVTILLANVCFFLADRSLVRFEVYYETKLRKKLKFK